MNVHLRRYFGTTLVCALVGFIVTASCKNTKLDSAWTTAPMLIDGRAQDWNGVTSHFIEESEASVAFANDNEQLYILVRTRDPRLASVIHRSGLKLWINSEGKRDKDFVIRYRGGPTREEMHSMIGGEQRRQMDRESQFMLPDTGKPSLTCFVKDRIVEMEIPADGSVGPAAAFGLDAGFFTYEFSLPLHECSVRSYGLAALPGQTISVGAQWGGSRRGMDPNRPGMGDMQMGSPPGGSRGGLGGGGKGGGGRGRGDRSQERSQPITEQDIQMTLLLAEAVGM
jgi:hypothetical protein